MDDPLYFQVRYLITARSDRDARTKAFDICVEQTAEMPYEIIPERIKKNFIGNMVSQAALTGNSKKTAGKDPEQVYDTIISWPLPAAGSEITQCLNLLFGNISLKPGICISEIDWSALATIFPGPVFGIDGIRSRLGVQGRPLTCSALKPMGLNSSELGERCYQMALGGLDIIKDDHGLANQEAAPFADRLKACLFAIERAAGETGKRTAFFPNITGDGFETWRRYEIAQEMGADGVLLSPQLTGLSLLKSLRNAGPPLPIIAHPAFSGTFVLNSAHGFTPDLFFGYLWRAAGADAVIYPNAGGRFLFTEEDCQAINYALQNYSSPFKTAFPAPGGGIQRKNTGDWIKKYGQDIILLIGGSLYQHPDGLQTAAREFQANVERFTSI